MKKSKSMCSGCRNNFYNGNNELGVKECWSFKDAEVVKRFAIGYWTPMDRKENFTQVEVLNCYHESGSGKRAFFEKLPEHLR